MQPMLLGGTPLPAARCGGASRLRCRRGARVAAPCAARCSAPQPPASARCGRREALLALGAALLSPAAARADEEPTFAADAPAADTPPLEAAPPAPPPQPAGAVRTLSPEERLLLEQNQRIKSLNRAPDDFPAFIRKGYEVKVLADGYVYEPNGLIYKDFEPGAGELPLDGQQVVFHYSAYNESGGIIDSSYRQHEPWWIAYRQGRPAETRLGINGMIPGFEAGLRSMRVGGRRRVIVPPELGPPVGPATFFSAKQFEVFDVELLAIKSCTRSTSGMFSTVSCN